MSRHRWEAIKSTALTPPKSYWFEKCIWGCGWRRKSIYRKFGPKLGLEYLYLKEKASLNRAPACVPKVAPIEVRCETTGCSRKGKIINTIRGFKKESERTQMLEQWADAHEQADICKRCGVLGVPVEE